MDRVDVMRFATMAETYDKMCQLLVPCYDWMQDEMLTVACADWGTGDAVTVVDLGAGSGILLEKFLMAFPSSRGYWVDSSPDFLAVAQQRLDRFGPRVEYVLRSLEDGWEACVPSGADAVVSMSAIHHLTSPDKQALYQRVFHLLKPGGKFINLDEMRTASQDAYLQSMRFWVRHVEGRRAQLTAEQVPHYEKWRAHFDRWRTRNICGIGEPKAKGDDLQDDFVEQLTWLRDAGYACVDLYFKYHLWSAIGGSKPNDQGEGCESQDCTAAR